MRPALLLTAFALLCAVLPAQKVPLPRAEFKAKPLPRGRVTGQVLCGDTRRPARGALVLLQPLSAKEEGPENGSMPAMTRVGMDGSYQMNHVAAGTYALLAVLPGYLSPLDQLDATGFNSQSEAKLRARLAEHNSITVPANGAVTGDLVLERGAAVSGRVLYPDGSPATQVSMQLEDVKAKPVKGAKDTADVGAMMRMMFTHQSTSTDDQGHFRLSGIAPGTYRLAAVPVPASGGGDEEDPIGAAIFMGMMPNTGALHVYAGDTLHAKDARLLELRTGEETGDLQITLPINSFHAVSGLLTAKDGRPLSLATLTLTDTSDSTLRFQTMLGENGTFRFPSVPTGSYQLSAADGSIVTPNPRVPASLATRTGTPVAAFAEGQTGVLVKDSDVTDVALALAETALKPAAKTPDEADEQQ